VQAYLLSLQHKNQNTFASVAPSSKADARMTLVSTSGKETIVEGWKDSSGWLIKSSLQPGVYFSCDDAGIKDLLKGKKAFERK
jgi:hypothetical protein